MKKNTRMGTLLLLLALMAALAACGHTPPSSSAGVPAGSASLPAVSSAAPAPETDGIVYPFADIDYVPQFGTENEGRAIFFPSTHNMEITANVGGVHGQIVGFFVNLETGEVRLNDALNYNDTLPQIELTDDEMREIARIFFEHMQQEGLV